MKGGRKKNKMNKKKLLLFGLPLLALTLVIGAVIFNYGIIIQILHVQSAIKVIETSSEEINCYDSGICRGNPIEISNIGNSEIDTQIIGEETTEGEKGVTDIKYIGITTLTEKTVDFTKDVWVIPEEAEKIGVEYIVVNGGFSAEVVDNEKGGYVLIYYKDNSDRFDSPAKAILVEDVEGNLPYGEDRNTDEYDYCETGEYDTCHGAKIWYVPQSAVSEDGSLDWSRASEFYYETELIQYNSDGIITIYPNSDLTIIPEYTISNVEGDYSVKTEVNPLI